MPWRKFVNGDNAHLTSQEAFDLLDRLLKYDHHDRLTCQEALQVGGWVGPRRPGADVKSGAGASGTEGGGRWGCTAGRVWRDPPPHPEAKPPLLLLSPS